MTTMPTGRSLIRPQHRRERAIEAALFLAAALGVLTTVGIVLVLALQTADFFRSVNPIEFFTGTVWSASITPFRWGILPLLTGTLLVAVLALIVAVPLGLLAAVYLAEYASMRVRNVVKPVLETIAGIPTIVLGSGNQLPHSSHPETARVRRWAMIQCPGRRPRCRSSWITLIALSG